MAAERHFPALICRITHPDPKQAAYMAAGWGAPVVQGEEFALLLSTGETVSA